MLTRAAKATHDEVVFARLMERLSGQGHRLDDVLRAVVRSRISLAEEMLAAGTSIEAQAMGSDGLLRSAVSRYYYSMYHACRAVVYFDIQGDNHDGHATLAGHLPATFPQRKIAQNNFKDMRSLRNEADYEPYERTGNWAGEAARAQQLAIEFLEDCKIYLQQKGL